MSEEYLYTMEAMQLSMAVLMPMIIVSLIISVVSIVAEWKMFVKAGRPGWACLVPFYNLWVSFDIVYGNGARMFLLLIPFANFVFLILYLIELANSFDQTEIPFKIGLIFLSTVFLCIIGFHPDIQYVGSKKDRES